jgi:YaiO family outer membrane protein
MKRLGCAGVICWVALAPAQAEPISRPTTLEVAHERASLSNGQADWRETSLQIDHRYAPRQAAGLALRQTRRFGLGDTAIDLSGSQPLTERATVLLEASVSPTHRVLAKSALGASLQYEFAPAWLLHTGFKNTRYDNANVNQGLLMLERYVGSFSGSIAWRPASALGQHANGFELRGNYYYGDKSMVGLIVASGQEATTVSSQTVVLADVRAVALVGRHWLRDDWALTYAISRTRQGSFYDRNGVRLGVQYAF